MRWIFRLCKSKAKMKWKTKFILVFLTILVSRKVYKVSARLNHSSVERNRAESDQRWNPSTLHDARHLSPTPHKSTVLSPESAQQWKSSALHGATHQSPTPHKSTIPSSTVRSDSVITDDQGIKIIQEDNFKWNMDAKNMNIGRKILTARKFSMRRAAKRHKAVVQPYTTGMSSSASPLKEAFVFQTLRPTFATDVPWPVQQNSKSPVVLTILPTDDENLFGSTFSPPADKAGTETEQDQTAGESNTNDDYLVHNRPRVTEHDRPTRSGTESKTQPLEAGAYYEITSSGIRWNTAHDYKTGAEHKTKKRYKKRKTAPRLTDDEKEDSDVKDEDDPGQSGSPIILVAVFGGILVVLCVFTGLARLWRNCKKRCLRRKDPEVGLIFPSSADFSEQLSEEEILFETMAKEREMETNGCSKSKTKTSNPPTYHLDPQATWILTDTPTSTPLMVATTVADTLSTEACNTVIDIPDSTHVDSQATRIPTDIPTSTAFMAASTAADTNSTEASTVIDIPDLSSPETSFTCSSLSDDFSWLLGTPRSSSSLTSVSSLEITSELGICSPLSLMESEPEISTQSASLTSVPAMPVKSDTKTTIESPVSPTFQPEVSIDALTSSILLTIEPEVITSDLPSTRPVTCAAPETTVPVTVQLSSSCNSATPKQFSSLNLNESVSDESTMTISMTTESSSSSRESCKTPVAPRDEVVITIEDDEDKVVIYASANSGTDDAVVDISGMTSEDNSTVTPTVGNVTCVTTEKADDVTKSQESAVGVTGEVGESDTITVERAAINISGITCLDENAVSVVENAAIEIPGVSCAGEDCVNLAEDALVKISGVTKEGEDELTVLDNAKMEISDQKSKGENEVTVVKNAAMEVSGVTSEQDGNGVMVVENVVVHLSGVTTKEEDRVTVVEDAEIKIYGENEDGIKVVNNAVIKISNVTNGLGSVVKIDVDNNADGITQPLEGNKRDFNENREKRLLSSKAIDKGASTSHQDTNVWDSIYKNRAKSMTDANKRRKKRLASSVALDKDTLTSSPDANAWDSIYKNRAKLMKKQKKQKKGKGVKPDVFSHNQIPHIREHIYSEISVVDHKRNPQVGCLCHYCEKHRQKSRGPRFFRLPRKLLSFKSKSSSKHDNSGYEACSSVKYTVPTSEACVSTNSAANSPTSSFTNAGEQQIRYLPNVIDQE